MRIAFIANNTLAGWGGSEELWSLAALHLHRRGHAVLACVQNWKPRPARYLELEQAGISVHTIRPRRAMRLRERARAAWRRKPPRNLTQATIEEAILPFAPDLVVVSQMQNLDGEGWAAALRQYGVPYALVAQAASELSWPDNELFDSARAAHRDARRSFFVARQNLELTQHELGIALSQAELVHNPFVVRHQQIPGWPADDGEYRLACVARLEPPAKGQDLLFQILAMPRWRERPLKLSLYGDGRHGTSLKALAGFLKLASVTFRGHTHDVDAIWKEHHGIILASRLEGTPLALIEAMLCHRFAIVTPVGGNADVVQDGISGFVSEAVSVPLIDAAMERAWERRAEWQQLGLEAGKRIRAVIPPDPVAHFADRILAAAR
jgi:glycosyltransferase involved in cell wall biosynthesis